MPKSFGFRYVPLLASLARILIPTARGSSEPVAVPLRAASRSMSYSMALRYNLPVNTRAAGIALKIYLVHPKIGKKRNLCNLVNNNRPISAPQQEESPMMQPSEPAGAAPLHHAAGAPRLVYLPFSGRC